ncbi:MAG: DUF2163 domain-containing protein [Hydrogenophilaceae bacterium]|jgi:uncharacterized phage protein (TIGR02218 family)|nr:DUF2163 domain-containing protein [Hydrogenophilaceae bacterium]
MRAIPAALAARLATGVTTLCTIWRVERRDAQAFGFSDHDRPLEIDGLVYEPLSGLGGGVIEKGADLSIDSASVAGALSSEAITLADLARGLWDGARVDIWTLDWADPSLKVHVFAGRLGEARRGAAAFEAELRGLQAPLNAPFGRVFSRFCDADVGDARCGAALIAPTYRGAGTIVEALSARAFTASGLAAFADGWFADGRVHWTFGGAADVLAHRAGGALATIELYDAADLAPAQTFEITAGCDKRFATCRAKFDNTANFRGFPHMPGPDAVIAGPVQGGDNDGGSRNT